MISDVRQEQPVEASQSQERPNIFRAGRSGQVCDGLHFVMVGTNSFAMHQEATEIKLILRDETRFPLRVKFLTSNF